MKSATRFGWTPAMAISALIMALVSPAVAQDTENTRATLAGLTGVEVLVEGMGTDAEKDGLAKSTLQTDVELKLRQAGICVLGENERFAVPGSPLLYLRVSTLLGEGLYVFDIILELNQMVRLVRNPSITLLTRTWAATGKFGLVGKNKLSTKREDVRDQVDQFINAYLAANPKK